MTLPKTLIIVIHPNFEQSIVSKHWIQELEKSPEKFVIHNLHDVYPDGVIDVEREQKMMESYDKIIFQFPFYWFNCPPFFKQWLDEVLLYGWAFGSKSNFKLAGKKMSMAISAGIDEKDYQATGKYKYTMEQLLAPFELTFEYIKADYQKPFILYGLEFHADQARIENSAKEYLEYLDSI